MNGVTGGKRWASLLLGLLGWICLAVVGQLCTAGQVDVVPAPDGAVLFADYEVAVNGESVDVYTARVLDPPFADRGRDCGGPYGFCNFDMQGQVTVTIRAKRTLRDTVVRPASAGVQLQVEDDHTLTLTLNQPCKISIEPDGKHRPLFLFANAVEKDLPDQDDPQVIFFGPGIHQVGRLNLSSDQTLYLAAGAVVKGGIVAEGDHIVIRGRGILDGSDWAWRKGPTPTVIGIQGKHVTVQGITILGASHWTIVPRHSQFVTVKNVKICNGRVQNDDGINPCNSQDVLITDCFIRSDDDCVALKGLSYGRGNNNVERIVVEKSVLWCDRARIFLLGHESRAEFMRDVTLRDLDIIHFSMTPFLFEPGEDMQLRDVTVEQIRIHGEGQRELARLRPVVNQYMRKKTPGHIQNVSFRDVTLTGQAGDYQIQMSGADSEHTVRDVTFQDVSILGQPLTDDSSRVVRGEHVHDVQFEHSKTR